MAGPGLIPAGAVARTNVVVDVAPLSATIRAEIDSKVYIYVKGVSRLLVCLDTDCGGLLPLTVSMGLSITISERKVLTLTPTLATVIRS